jgi:hypothetical protein
MFFVKKEEKIERLFIDCRLAKTIWRIVHMSFGIPLPKNITNLFKNWLNGLNKRVKSQTRVGVCALLWAIWHLRNDLIFNKSYLASFLQVIHLATHWIRTWLCL